jgi:uncharacterized protein YdhG (YjbR/CyaY superfamily)
MSCGSIYKIVFPNEKHYIGLTTTSLEQRKYGHNCHAKRGDTRCLYNALRKYDMVDTFELVEIDTADTLEELCEKEIGYILMYNSHYIDGYGYNMTYGGDGTNGYIMTEDDRQHISEAQIKRFEVPGAKEKHCIIMNKLFDDNPELRQKMSELKNEYYEKHPELRQRLSEIKKMYHEEHPEAGKEHSERLKEYFATHPDARNEMSERMKMYHEEHPEARQQMSEIKKEYYANHPDAGQKISESLYMHYANHPETREKCSESQKKRFAKPEEIQKCSQSQKKRFQDNPDERQKYSEIMKKRCKDNPECLKKKLDTQGLNKQFDVFTTDGKYIKTFTYQFEAREYLQKEYNITSTINIGAVLTGRLNSSAGFVFKYK